MTGRQILVIAGPTGTGKSRLAVEAARQLGAEIVSADSRQVYRGMDIGTATPTLAERGDVTHHLLSVLDLTARVNAGWFADQARVAIDAVWDRGNDVIVVGGSTLYVHALVQGLAPLPSLPAGLERDLHQTASTESGRETLFRELRRLDPEAAATLDPSKSQRLVRLLGVVRHTGQRVSEMWNEATAAPFDTRLVILQRPREQLYDRIDARVLNMIERGLLDEVETVLTRWPGSRAILKATIGYRELLPVLEGEASLDEAVALIQRNSRRYAKRQLTWYRRYPEAEWIDADSVTPESVVDGRRET